MSDSNKEYREESEESEESEEFSSEDAAGLQVSDLTVNYYLLCSCIYLFFKLFRLWLMRHYRAYLTHIILLL